MTRTCIYILLLLSTISTHLIFVQCQEDTAEPAPEGEPTAEPAAEPTPEETPKEEPTAEEPAAEETPTEEPAAEVEPTPVEEPTPPDAEETKAGASMSTNCGGVLQGMAGEISYKNGMSYNNSERCSWTVEAPGSARIDFTLEEDGIIQKKEDFIKVGFFSNSDYKNPSSFVEVMIDHTSTNKTVSVPGPVAFVRFYSDAKIRGMGFRLTFKGMQSSGEEAATATPVSYAYSNLYYEGNEGVIKYFNEGSTEKQMERVSIVIQPKMAPYAMAIKYFGGKCDGKRDEKDALSFFSRATSRIAMTKQFCNTTKLPTWQSNTMDEVLITYSTTVTSPNNGFHLIWVPM